MPGEPRAFLAVEGLIANTEWDFFATPRTVTALSGQGKLPAIVRQVTFKRASDWRIHVGARVLVPLADAAAVSRVLDGPIAEEEVEGFDQIGSKYTFQLTVLGYGTIRDYVHEQARVKLQPPIVRRVSFSSAYKAEDAYLSQWYLNGPESPIPFCRLTKRFSEQSFQRIRAGFEVPFSAAGLSNHEESGGGHLLIGLYSFTVAVATVLEGHGPAWARPISIEYSRASSEFPAATVRDAVAEIVAFVLGRELLCVGYSVLDSAGVVLRAEGHSPWGPGIRDVCRQSTRPPVAIYEFPEHQRAEDLLGKLASVYLARRAELCLDQVLWQYWMARRSPLGPNIAQMGAALNKLIDAWFSSSESRSRGVSIPKAEFDKLFADEFTSIEGKLRGHAKGQRILNRFKNAFQMGVAEKSEAFFEEIGLKIGATERDAMKARNPPAHGTLPEDADIPKVMRQSNALETLFHRALLKVLGFDGTYVDYASRDWQSRPVDHPIPD